MVLLPIAPNLSNRHEVIERGNVTIEEEQARVAPEEKDETRLYTELSRTLDEDAQAKWEKITTDPVWHKLTEKNKADIWEAFEKTYVTEIAEKDDSV